MAVPTRYELTHIDCVLYVPHLEPVGVGEEENLPEVGGGEVDGVEACPVDLEGQGKGVMMSACGVVTGGT